MDPNTGVPTSYEAAEYDELLNRREVLGSDATDDCCKRQSNNNAGYLMKLNEKRLLRDYGKL